MRNSLCVGLILASTSASAAIQSTSVHTNINFHIDNYVELEIPNKQVRMTLIRNKQYSFDEHTVSVPINLDWNTDRGVSFTATCSSKTDASLCRRHGYVKFPLMGMPFMYSDIYSKGQTLTYLVDGTGWRSFKGAHHVNVGVKSVNEFIKNFGNKESRIVFTLHIEANV